MAMYHATVQPTSPLCLAFRQPNSGKVVSLRRLTRTLSTSASIATDGAAYGIGSDTGRVLYWLGERLLGVYIEVALWAKLASVRRLLARRNSNKLTPYCETLLWRACEDLVTLCQCALSPTPKPRVCADCASCSAVDHSDEYPARFRLRAVKLLWEVVRPLDPWSMVLLESNFAEVLAAFQSEAYVVRKAIGDMTARTLGVVEAYNELSCKCPLCLRTLKQRMCL